VQGLVVLLLLLLLFSSKDCINARAPAGCAAIWSLALKSKLLAWRSSKQLRACVPCCVLLQDFAELYKEQPFDIVIDCLPGGPCAA
jgi:hypothetical protein